MGLGWGGAISALGKVVLAYGSAHQDAAILLVGMCGFILVFVATWGNGYWVVVTEVTAAGGPQYGGASQSISTMVLFASGWITSLTFVSVTEAGGPWALTIYAAVIGFGALYALCLLPEMRGCTLEQCAERINEMPIEAFCTSRKEAKAASATTEQVTSSDVNAR